MFDSGKETRIELKEYKRGLFFGSYGPSPNPCTGKKSATYKSWLVGMRLSRHERLPTRQSNTAPPNKNSQKAAGSGTTMPSRNQKSPGPDGSPPNQGSPLS